jgi:putative endonuclease
MHYTKQTGLQGEQLVVDKLRDEGYEIVARNYTKPYGEVDIIAKNAHELLFIEVKTRCNPLFDPAEQIPRSKQKRIIAVAKHFLATHTGANTMICRFDVALVVAEQGKINISYLANAFTE